MKRNLKILALTIFILILSGCIKFNTNIEIKKNKSMNFEIIYALDTAYFGDEVALDETDIDEFKDQGYIVENYSKGSLRGYTIKKTFENIDDVSSTKDTEYDLANIVSDSKNINAFKVKKGFFKNTYIAKFNLDTSEASEEISTEEGFEDLYQEAMSTLDLSFNVKLPYKVINNNATTVSEDGKNLSWDLLYNNENIIQFEFFIYNMYNIFFCFVGIAITMLIIILIINKKKTPKDGNKEVLKPNVPQTTNNTETFLDQNNVNTLESTPQPEILTNTFNSEPEILDNPTYEQSNSNDNILYDMDETISLEIPDTLIDDNSNILSNTAEENNNANIDHSLDYSDNNLDIFNNFETISTTNNILSEEPINDIDNIQNTNNNFDSIVISDNIQKFDLNINNDLDIKDDMVNEDVSIIHEPEIFVQENILNTSELFTEDFVEDTYEKDNLFTGHLDDEPVQTDETIIKNPLVDEIQNENIPITLEIQNNLFNNFDGENENNEENNKQIIIDEIKQETLVEESNVASVDTSASKLTTANNNNNNDKKTKKKKEKLIKIVHDSKN